MATASPDPSPNKKQNPSNSYLKYSGLAIQLLVTIFVAGWIGYKLDQWIGNTIPAMMILFGFLGFGGMMYQVYRSINNNQ